jgi:hypothetical protein
LMAVTLKIGEHLTRDRYSDAAAVTYTGQAHFAGSGPRGKTCRECFFWRPEHGGNHVYRAGDRQLKDALCVQHRKLRGAAGKPVPHSATACKYFQQAEDPPLPFDPRRRL